MDLATELGSENRDKFQVFAEGDLTSCIFSFSESHGISSSSLVDFSTRVAWSVTDPRAGCSKPIPGASAYSWERDGVGGLCWQEHLLPYRCCAGGLGSAPKRPKTFKPILLYQRPEESRRSQCGIRPEECFSVHDGFSVWNSTSGGGSGVKTKAPTIGYSLSDPSGAALFRTNRDDGSCWTNHSRVALGVCEHPRTKLNNDLHSDLIPRAPASDSRSLLYSKHDTCPCRYYSPSPKSSKNNAQSPLPHMFQRTSFPTVAQPSRNIDTGPASEIRRALLQNHSVYTDHCSICVAHPEHLRTEFMGNCTNLTNLQGNSFSFEGNQGLSSLTAHTCTSKPSSLPFPGKPLAAPHQMPVPLTKATPPIAGDVADGWQEWAGKYGSFLQMLYAPDYPISVGSPTLPRVPADETYAVPEKPLLDVNQGLAMHTALRSVSPGEPLGLHTAYLDGGAEDADDRESRKYQCPYCDVACTNNGQLKGHLRVHTGEKPYRCDCGRAFARNEELTRHRRIHSGLRPHHCSTCGKRFGRKDHLNKHQKTHLRTSEKKVHVCHVTGCRQRYTRSDALARHQWGAHGIRAKTSRLRPPLTNDRPAHKDPPVPENSVDGKQS